MNQELGELIKIAATFVGTVGCMQMIAMRGKKLRREEMAEFELRLETIENNLRRIEEAGHKKDEMLSRHMSKIDTLAAQVSDMRDLLQKLLDIQLQEKRN